MSALSSFLWECEKERKSEKEGNEVRERGRREEKERESLVMTSVLDMSNESLIHKTNRIEKESDRRQENERGRGEGGRERPRHPLKSP